MTYAFLIISLPIYIALYPPHWWPTAPLSQKLYLVGVLGVLCMLALWIAYAQTTSYEFDGVDVVCYRYPNRIVWTHPVAGLVSARRVYGRGWDGLRLKWVDKRHTIYLSDDLERALYVRA